MILRWIKKLELFILLLLFWFILNGQVNIRLIIFGSIFSIVIIRMTYEILFVYDDHLTALPSLWHFLWFGVIVFIAIIKSSVSHCFRIIRNDNNYRTFNVKLNSTNVMINTLIANAITLTPGTITLNLEEDCLEVVGFANSDEEIEGLIKDIKKYEKPFYYKRGVK